MKLRKHNGIESKKQGFWIEKRSLVYIPKGRANEIPKVVEEHHELEAQWHSLL